MLKMIDLYRKSQFKLKSIEMQNEKFYNATFIDENNNEFTMKDLSIVNVVMNFEPIEKVFLGKVRTIGMEQMLDITLLGGTIHNY